MTNRGGHRIEDVNNYLLRSAIAILNTAKELKMTTQDFLQFWETANKTDNPVTAAKNTMADPATLLLSRNSDRKFPLDTVELQSFNLKHGKT